MLPSRIETVLFDAGGTLVTLDYAFIADLGRRHGLALEEAALPAAEGLARVMLDRAIRDAREDPGSDGARRPRYFATMLAALGLAGARLEGLLEELERAHRQANLWRRPQPGALETLRALAGRGVRLAVVSNADGRVEAVLRRLGLAAHLELIVDSHHEGVEKPDPEIFRRALSRLGVGPERAVYVGDIYAIDALGARAAGLAPIILDSTGSFGELDCAKIAALGELLDSVAAPQRGEP